MLNVKLVSTLTEKLDEWANENCEEDWWADANIYWTKDGPTRLATICVLVLEEAGCSRDEIGKGPAVSTGADMKTHCESDTLNMSVREMINHLRSADPKTALDDMHAANYLEQLADRLAAIREALHRYRTTPHLPEPLAFRELTEAIERDSD